MIQRENLNVVLERARQKAQGKEEKKSQTRKEVLTNLVEKYNKTVKDIEAIDAKIAKLQKQKETLVSKNKKRKKYYEDISK